jgi:hypothetical protein
MKRYRVDRAKTERRTCKINEGTLPGIDSPVLSAFNKSQQR